MRVHVYPLPVAESSQMRTDFIRPTRWFVAQHLRLSLGSRSGKSRYIRARRWHASGVTVCKHSTTFRVFNFDRSRRLWPNLSPTHATISKILRSSDFLICPMTFLRFQCELSMKEVPSWWRCFHCSFRFHEGRNC